MCIYLQILSGSKNPQTQKHFISSYRKTKLKCDAYKLKQSIDKDIYIQIMYNQPSLSDKLQPKY